MGEVLNWAGYLALAAGGFFFIAGTLGLLRFPDACSRLHAVTKADTLGLGFVVLGLSLLIRELQPALVMLLCWLLILASSATACQLLARYQSEEPQADAPGTTKEDEHARR